MEPNNAFSENAPTLAGGDSVHPYDPILVGERLRIAREIITPGGSIEDAAAMVGVERDTWWRWENGKAKLPIDIAFKIHEAHPVERDWLLFGEERFLNAVQRRTIAEAAARVAAAPKIGRPAKARA